MASNQDFRGAHIAGGVAGRDYTGDVIHHHGNSAQLDQLKAEIQALWVEVAGNRPTETIVQQAAIVGDIENDPTLRQRFVGMLKAAGTEAFKEAIDNPAVNVLVAAIEAWQEG